MCNRGSREGESYMVRSRREEGDAEGGGAGVEKAGGGQGGRRKGDKHQDGEGEGSGRKSSRRRHTVAAMRGNAPGLASRSCLSICKSRSVPPEPYPGLL